MCWWHFADVARRQENISNIQEHQRAVFPKHYKACFLQKAFFHHICAFAFPCVFKWNPVMSVVSNTLPGFLMVTFWSEHMFPEKQRESLKHSISPCVFPWLSMDKTAVVVCGRMWWHLVRWKHTWGYFSSRYFQLIQLSKERVMGDLFSNCTNCKIWGKTNVTETMYSNL